MPVNVFGNCSIVSEIKIDTSLFVQKPYLRNTYIESILEDIEIKNQFINKNSPDPIHLRKPASKLYVDNKFKHQSIIKNTAHVEFNGQNLDNVRLVKINSMPAVGEHLTVKCYVDRAISKSVDEPTLERSNQDNNFNNHDLTNIISITLNTQAVNDNRVITKTYVDQFHQENERSRIGLGSNFYKESNDLVKNNQKKYFLIIY